MEPKYTDTVLSEGEICPNRVACTDIVGLPIVNPVAIIRNILDNLMLDYDEKSFDKAELWYYRNPKDYDIVLYGTPYELIKQLLDSFGGFIVYHDELL